MRYNKHELIALASQTSQNFDREGVFILKERQDGFFRRSEGFSVRWFRLRGNLLFYLKGPEPWYEPVGVIVLGHHQITVQSQDDNGHWPFQIDWENGVCYRMATFLECERTLWLAAIDSATYENMTQSIIDLTYQLSNTVSVIELHTHRLNKKILNHVNEIPLCEVSLACDNLVCDANGQPPSAFACSYLLFPEYGLSVRYSATEVVKKSSNPVFCRSIMFRSSDCVNSDTLIRFGVYDMREMISQTGVSLGSVTMRLKDIQEAQRLRVPLLAAHNKTMGFITINSWCLESGVSTSNATTERSSVDFFTPKIACHRRAQSLPPLLGLNLKYPSQPAMVEAHFVNAHQATYRFQTGLGGDVIAHEMLAEPRCALTVPVQLAKIFMKTEEDHLESLLMYSHLTNQSSARILELTAAHLGAYCGYRTNEAALTRYNAFFKPSAEKENVELAYLPINLHLQRMWAHNDTLNKTGFHDFITVGAFTAHNMAQDYPGGLIRLLQQSKNSSSDVMAVANRLEAEWDKLAAMQTARGVTVAAIRRALSAVAEARYDERLLEEIEASTMHYIGLWSAADVAEAFSDIGWDRTLVDAELKDELEAVTISNRTVYGGAVSLDEAGASYWAYALDEAGALGEACASDEGGALGEACASDEGGALGEACASNEAGALGEACASDEAGALGEACASDEAGALGEACASDEASASYGAGALNEASASGAVTLSELLAQSSVLTDPAPTSSATIRAALAEALVPSSYQPSLSCVARALVGLSLNDPPAPQPGASRTSKNKDKKKGKKVRRERITASPPSLLAQGLSFLAQSISIRRENFAIFNGYTISMEDLLANVLDHFTRILRAGKCSSKEFEDCRVQACRLVTVMDEALRWSQLAHTALTVTWETPAFSQQYSLVQRRRDVCFSQALSAVSAGLMCWLASTDPKVVRRLVAGGVGPLCGFEGLLSLYAQEKTMWGDMVVAVEDLHTVRFQLVRLNSGDGAGVHLTGRRNSLVVELPVCDSLLDWFDPAMENPTFTITAVFFNIGVNDKAGVAATLGECKPQYQSNEDNLERLENYCAKYCKLCERPDSASAAPLSSRTKSPQMVMESLRSAVLRRTPKDGEVLRLAAEATRLMHGIRFTSCKSAKDRTAMSVTLEQTDILMREYHLDEHNRQKSLDIMRSEGCRRANTFKNIGNNKYAFNKRQVMSLPAEYRPPPGCYGSTYT